MVEDVQRVPIPWAVTIVNQAMIDPIFLSTIILVRRVLSGWEAVRVDQIKKVPINLFLSLLPIAVQMATREQEVDTVENSAEVSDSSSAPFDFAQGAVYIERFRERFVSSDFVTPANVP